MDDHNQSSVSISSEADNFLEVVPIPEDWGGDGQGRMSLSGRRTAIASGHVPGQYQYFHTHRISEQAWQIHGIPEQTVAATCQMLSWHENSASTAKVVLPSQFEMPAGRFTADLEIFVLSGAIQVGEWKLRKHGYSFIPAGVRVGPWKVLNGEAAEILWMENGSVQYQDLPNHSQARINEFIPALDSKLLPWGKTDTRQFTESNKKWLRKAPNGGGAWLLAILPHYDGKQAMIQSYNEEAYCLAGCCNIGDYLFAKDHFGYVPSFTTSPRHISEDGCLFFIRVDRDLSQSGAVLSYAH
ncbi:DUF4437 domain-containing protein [Leptolyngbya sp. FACHB-711]|uniref:DUF4437 domain-containing protein n=1 Tax=unclassified Leptolyngbya TaxID=2650499 RepID=UPI00168782A1|nr:DUF4437 domain-containing protein [Leptolyngbya sp. FACHB-711]MBD2022904.1 DUF4437 domain-containing protein [Leptolyngbya sp. FACHB-711]